MSLFKSIPQPVPVYTDIRDQWARRKECAIMPLSIYHDSARLPLSMIVRPTSPYTLFTVKMKAAGGAVIDQGSVPMTIASDGVTDYLWRDPLFIPPVPVPNGKWWAEYTDNGGNVFYTEQVDFTDCFDDKIKLEYKASCTRLGIPFSLVPGTQMNFGDFMFSFWMDRGAGQPSSTTEVEEEYNGKETVIKSQVTTRTWMVNDLMPPYIVDCLHAMKYMDYVAMTDGMTLEVATLAVKEISADWSESPCMAKTTTMLQFTDQWRSMCCEESAVNPIDCGTSDVTLAYGAVANEDEGLAACCPDKLFLITTDSPGSPISAGEAALFDSVTSSWVKYVPAIGTLFLAENDPAGLDPDNPYNIYYSAEASGTNPTGVAFLPFCPPPVAIDEAPNIRVTTAYIPTAAVALDRFARIKASAGSDLFGTVVWEGTETDLQGPGAVFPNPYPGETVYFRIEYFTIACGSYGLSKFKAIATTPASPCTQPTSLHIVVPEGESVDNIILDVSDAFDGYFMIEGDPTVHASADGGVSLSSGEYCLYTTDASGVPNGAATAIYLFADSLTTLDVSAWTAATYINLQANSLAALDVSAWTAATTIVLYANGLTVLDASAWTAATYIELLADGLTALDVSAWTAATTIYLYANGLTTLDASAWTAATTIYLSADSLTTLEVPSMLAAVTAVYASNCPLDQESVDAILAAAVANPAITAATFILNGSCAAPSTAGYADKATLIARGCTVYTN